MRGRHMSEYANNGKINKTKKNMSEYINLRRSPSSAGVDVKPPVENPAFGLLVAGKNNGRLQPAVVGDNRIHAVFF